MGCGGLLWIFFLLKIGTVIDRINTRQAFACWGSVFITWKGFKELSASS